MKQFFSPLLFLTCLSFVPCNAREQKNYDDLGYLTKDIVMAAVHALKNHQGATVDSNELFLEGPLCSFWIKVDNGTFKIHTQVKENTKEKVKEIIDNCDSKGISDLFHMHAIIHSSKNAKSNRHSKYWKDVKGSETTDYSIEFGRSDFYSTCIFYKGASPVDFRNHYDEISCTTLLSKELFAQATAKGESPKKNIADEAWDYAMISEILQFRDHPNSGKTTRHTAGDFIVLKTELAAPLQYLESRETYMPGYKEAYTICNDAGTQCVTIFTPETFVAFQKQCKQKIADEKQRIAAAAQQKKEDIMYLKDLLKKKDNV